MEKEKKFYVINRNGEREPFSFQKIYQSTQNVCASKEIAIEIAKQIEKEIFNGISTAEISERVFELLLEKSPRSAIRFNLKRAMEKLGPTGFSFEKFIGRIFESEGFEVKLNQKIPGVCTDYEIDFLAKKDNLLYIGECKYHNLPGQRVDIQVALANYARFLDIKNGKFFDSKVCYKSFLITNTKFTEKAIKYSECVGVKLLGWKYPRGGGLEFLIEKNNLYPITILPSITKNLAEYLIAQKIVLVNDVFSERFEKLKIKEREKIKKEAEILLRQ